jgi:hypothetical protein
MPSSAAGCVSGVLSRNILVIGARQATQQNRIVTLPLCSSAVSGFRDDAGWSQGILWWVLLSQ